jgi:hypothetical protein
MISAFSASEVVSSLGLGKQLGPLLEEMGVILIIVAALLVGFIVIIVAGPLNSTATIATVGGVGLAALTAVGAPPVAAFLQPCPSGASESASPPGAAPLYVAAGTAEGGHRP